MVRRSGIDGARLRTTNWLSTPLAGHVQPTGQSAIPRQPDGDFVAGVFWHGPCFPTGAPMPSWTHEGLVRAIARRPDLAVALLAPRGHAIGGEFRPLEADLTDLDPAELRADLVRMSEGGHRHALVVEAQLRI